MVWAGVVYDERGYRVDIDNPYARLGRAGMRDTRIPDDEGRLFNGYTGRWEHPDRIHADDAHHNDATAARR